MAAPGTLLGLVLVVGAASFLVVRQPLSAPWWFYGDADATYASSALNVVVGRHINYLDHPGLPETEILALSFEAESLPSGGPNRGWAGAVMLNLDRTRLIVRGFAVLFFVGGALAAFALLTRLFRHWSWGAAGGLLWLAQPELPDVMQIRRKPDVLLLLADRRLRCDPSGRTPISALASLRRPPGRDRADGEGECGCTADPGAARERRLLPGDGWPVRLRSELRAWLSRHRWSLCVAAALWIAGALVLNLRAPPRYSSGWRGDLVTECVLGGAVYLLAALLVRRSSSNSDRSL